MTQEPPHTHLFVLRLWQADAQEDSLEYRGRVQHVLNGETRHFRDWGTLIEFLAIQMERSKDSCNQFDKEADNRPNENQERRD